MTTVPPGFSQIENLVKSIIFTLFLENICFFNISSEKLEILVQILDNIVGKVDFLI